MAEVKRKRVRAKAYINDKFNSSSYDRLKDRSSKALILASIGGCDENNAMTPLLSLIPKAAICSGNGAGST